MSEDPVNTTCSLAPSQEEELILEPNHEVYEVQIPITQVNTD